MRLIKYLAKHKGAVLLVFVLLIGQAYCDLMLPRYTASLVDVGIQQSGVEHVSAETLSQDTYDAIALMLPSEDEAVLRDCYSQDGSGAYKMTQQGFDQREWLDSKLAFPMVLVNALAQAHTGDSSSQVLPTQDLSSLANNESLMEVAKTITPEQRQYLLDMAAQGNVSLSSIVDACKQGIFEKEQIVAVVSALRESMPMPDDLIRQQAIVAAKAEYERAGVDTGAMQLNYLLFTAAKMMGFVALSVVIATLVGLVAARTGAKIGRELRSRLFAKVISFSDAEVQRFSTASLITRGTNDIQLIQMMSIMLLRMVLYAPILAVGGVIMVSQTDFSMGWIVALAIVLMLTAIFILMAIVMPKFRIMQKLIDRVNLVSREMLSGVSVVRAFGRQEHEQRRFDEASYKLMSTQLFTNRVMTFLMPIMMLVMNGIAVVIVWTGSQAIDAGTVQTGDLIASITYSMVIIMGFLMLGMLAIIAPRADVSAHRIDEVLEAELSIADPAAEHARAPLAQLDEASKRSVGATITFDHVDFRYDDSSECVLSDVTFTAEAGKTCAIIGSTGSGKSTVIKLIERFYDVSGGKVTIDGVDVRDIPQHELRTQLGYVPQKAFLFTGTIESNVGYGVEPSGHDEYGMPVFDEAGRERIAEASRVAQATEFIESKEFGYASDITQGGTNVSGGQRQRLAIARALATDARAFLFDDSFSALDYKTDALLRQALATNMEGKTQIIVAQRIATVLHADKIIVLDEGRVVGEGTHEQLMQTCEQYREIAFSQLAPEELEGHDAPAFAGQQQASATSDAEGGDNR